jgi:L-lactate permease
MLRWIRNVALAAALVAVPFQGMAAALAVLLCHGDPTAHAAHGAPASGEHHHHGDTHEPQAPPASDGSDSLAYHLCCNLAASVPLSVIVAAALPEFTLRAPVPDSLHDLYDPEQPQRPPLA